MLLFWLIALESIILFEAFIANYDGLLTRCQAQRRHGNLPKRKLAVFVEHWGVLIGDTLIVTPLVAWMLTYYSSQWNFPAIAGATVAGFIIGTLMLNMWRKGSMNLIEPFARHGRVSFNGWVHYWYMIFHLTVIFLFFFATSHVTSVFVWMATIGLGIHVTIGLIQPEWVTHGKVSSANKCCVLVAWIVLLGRGWFLAQS